MAIFASSSLSVLLAFYVTLERVLAWGARGREEAVRRERGWVVGSHARWEGRDEGLGPVTGVDALLE